MRVFSFTCAALVLLAGCHDRSLTVCDITQPDCQQDIYYTDLRLRGDGYDPFAGIPPIRTISEEQFREELEREATTSAAQNPPTPWWDEALLLLGLVSSTGDTQGQSIDNQVKNTAAFYSFETRDVTVISHPGLPTDPFFQFFANMSYLAHELVHALQDHEINLHLNPQSTDQYFAEKAIIEGDASLYQRLFEFEIALPPNYLSSPDPLAYFSAWRQANLSDDASVQDNFASLGPPFYAAAWLVYPLGGVWLSDRWDKGGNSAVRHAYGSAPQRSLDFLLGPGATSPASKDIACPPTAPAEFTNNRQPYGVDSFGAVYFFAYLMGAHVPASDSLSSSLLWRYDLIFVYYNQSTQKTAVTWRIELASPLPDSVLALLTNVAGPSVVQNGNTLLITASDDPTFLATWNPWTACPAQ